MFRFTIRDVLWLMVVVAVALGWFNTNKHYEEALRSARAFNLEIAGARGSAEMQAMAYKRAFEQAEAKLKAATQPTKESEN